MRHPFDNIASEETDSLPTRRTALERIALAAAGAVGLAGAARAEERLSTEAVGEEGDGRRMMDVTKALNEGGYYNRGFIPRPQPTDVSPERLLAAWESLADPVQVYQGVATLVSAKQAVPFLNEKLKPTIAADATQVARLVEQLDDTAFATRQKATTALERMGLAAEPALRKLLESKPPLEVARRVEHILAVIQKQRAQVQHGMQALSLHGSPDALKLILSLADGPKEANLTTEAQTALTSMGNFCWAGWSQRGQMPYFKQPARQQDFRREIEAIEKEKRDLDNQKK